MLAISHQPVESATGWEMLLEELKQRGLSSAGLIVADGLSGLEEAVAKAYRDQTFSDALHTSNGGF